MAQAIVGLDWIELAIRGAVLGWVLATVHAWYASRSDRYWPTVLYLFICVYAYYTFRASTFSPLYMIVYRFMPAVIIVKIAAVLMPRRSRPSRYIH